MSQDNSSMNGGSHAIPPPPRLGYNTIFIQKTIEILNIFNIPNLKSEYYLTDDDLAYICDQFNMNLCTYNI